MGTDADWEQWGRLNPYYGVITDDKFRNKNLTNAAKKEFFESGQEHVEHVIQVIRRHLDQGFSPKRVLEFGCGTGRLLIPFAGIAEQVTGLDVSESMLQEARKNCAARSVTNVRLLKSDDDLSLEEEQFDLIHSFIVFQHIPVERGRRLFMKLLEHLSTGGTGVLHILYAKANFIRSYGADPLIQLRRLNHKIPSFLNRDPKMQMNPYNLNELLFLLQMSGIRNFFVEYTNHGGELGVLLYFQKPSAV